MTLLIAALVLGGVFFFVSHDPRAAAKALTDDVGAEGEFATSSNMVQGLVFSSIALLGAVLVLRNRSQRRVDSFVLPILVIGFVSWSCLSLGWSGDTRATTIRLGLLLITCIGGFGLSRGLTPMRWMELTLLITGVYLAIGIFAELATGTFRPWSAGYRFAGTLHPNIQGGMLVVFSLAAYCKLRWQQQHRLRWALLLAVGLLFLILTKSRTACAGLVLAVGLIEWVATPSWKPVIVSLALAWVVCVIAFPFIAWGVDLNEELNQTVLLGRADESEALNGRGPLWSALMPYVHSHFWIGHGYESFWTERHRVEITNAVAWTPYHTHSDLLNMMLGVGLVGTLLYMAMMFTAARRSVVAFRKSEDPAFAFLFGLTVSFLISGLLEVNSTPPNLQVLLLCAGVSYVAFPAHVTSWIPIRPSIVVPPISVSPYSLQ